MSEIVLSFGSYSNRVTSDYFGLQSLEDENIHFMTTYPKKYPRVLICDYPGSMNNEADSVDLKKLTDALDWDGVSSLIDRSQSSQIPYNYAHRPIWQPSRLHERSFVEVPLFSCGSGGFSTFVSGTALITKKAF